MSVRVFDRRLLLILFLQLAASVAFVLMRTIDADEGFYLAAAQRVADGMLPYVDFFFPQMPLFPFTFFGLAGWGINSLLILRFVSAIAGIGTSLVMYLLVRRYLRDEKLALIATFLVAFSGLSLAWHTTFKPYAIVDLALLISFYFFVSFGEEESRSGNYIFLSCFFLGLTVNLRSVVAILIPIYLLVLAQRASKNPKFKWKWVLLAVCGFALPSIPSLYLLSLSPGQFWFDNLGFHLQREPIEPLSALLAHKAVNLGKFLVLPQTILLLGASIGSLLVVRRQYVSSSIVYKPAAVFAAMIATVYLIPTPVHLQYFQQTIPYLVILALPCAAFVLSYDRLKILTKSAGFLYLAGILPFVYVFILAPREREQRFELAHMKQAVESIQMNSEEGDTILAEWAGYSALASRPQIAGSEHVGFHFPLKIIAGEYAKYHLLTNDAIVEVLASQRPQLVVVNYEVYPEWESTLNANYRLVEQSNQTLIFKKRDNEAL